MQQKPRLVWDLPTRLFHWLFAFSILGSWYTAEQEGELIDLHMKLGYFILGLVIFRMIWGFVGTKHARFGSFFPTPKRIRDYLSTNRSSQNHQYAGHNPLGSLMVFLMLSLVFLQAVSGLFIDDDIFSSGPYYGQLGDQVGEIMSFIHHNAFDVMIFAIALHIAAILYYRFAKQTDLVTPMITGKKPEDSVKEKDAIAHSKIGLALLLGLAVAGFVYWLVVINVPIEEEYFY